MAAGHSEAAARGTGSGRSVIDDYDLPGHSDATRDIGRALQREEAKPRRAASWHGRGTEAPTSGSVAQPGGFRRHFVLSAGGGGGQGSSCADPGNTTTTMPSGEDREGKASPHEPAEAAEAATLPAGPGIMKQRVDYGSMASADGGGGGGGGVGGVSEDGTRGGGGGGGGATGVAAAPNRRGSSSASGSSYAQETTLLSELLRVQERGGADWDGFDDEDDRPLGLDPRLLSPLLPICPRRKGQAARGITQHRHLVLMIVKGFTGSAVLYLPHCFARGGLVLAALTIISVCLVSVFCARWLIDCADTVMARKAPRQAGALAEFQAVPGLGRSVPSYSDLGEAALGSLGRSLVDACLISSQLGFAATYIIFISANLREVVEVLSKCNFLLQQNSLFPGIVLVLVPLAWLRSLKYFAMMNFTSAVFMSVGLLAIAYVAGWHMQTDPPTEPVQWANLDALAVTLGTAVYAFEGIGMILPMYEETDPTLRPQFKDALTQTLVTLLVLFVLFASFCYLSFGAHTQTIVLLHLPLDGGLRPAVQLLYCAALAMSHPLALFPVTRLLEARWQPFLGRPDAGAGPDAAAGGRHLGALGGEGVRRKALRAALVAATGLLALPGPGKLSDIVALIGALSCAPLAITGPALLHLRLVSTGRKWLNVGLALAGTCLTLVCVSSALSSWGTAKESLPRVCAAAARKAAAAAVAVPQLGG